MDGVQGRKYIRLRLLQKASLFNCLFSLYLFVKESVASFLGGWRRISTERPEWETCAVYSENMSWVKGVAGCLLPGTQICFSFLRCIVEVQMSQHLLPVEPWQKNS